MGGALYVAANAANSICAGRKRECAENDSNRDKSGQLHDSLSNGMRVSALLKEQMHRVPSLFKPVMPPATYEAPARHLAVKPIHSAVTK